MTTRRSFLASVPLLAVAVSLRPKKNWWRIYRADVTLRRRSSPWWQTRGDIEFSGPAWLDEAAFRDRLMRDYLAGRDVYVPSNRPRPVTACTFGITA